MKKLLLINSVTDYGSTGHIVEDLRNLAEQNGFKAYIAYGRKKRPPQKYRIYFGNVISFFVHVFFTFITDKHGFYSKYVTKKLIKKMKKINPDIIHLHNLHGYYINIQLLFDYLKKIHKPVIWTLHDCWTYTGHCSHYTFINCNGWKTVCRKCPQKYKYPISFIIDNSTWNYKRKKKLFTSLDSLVLVTPSLWLCNEVKESYLSKYNVIPIYNGIDIDLFKPSKNNPYKKICGKHVILAVANIWDDRKGLNDLIKLNSIINHNKYCIVIIGLKKKQISNLQSTIICLERTDSIQELIDYYTFASVYFNASVEETLGMTTVEAQACGTPCVVYNSTAIPETVKDGETGLIVEPNDIDAVYKAIIKICGTDKAEYSEKCMNWVREKFDKTKNYKQYLDLYTRFCL